MPTSNQKWSREDLVALDLPAETGSDLKPSSRMFPFPLLKIVQENNVAKIKGATGEDAGKLFIQGVKGSTTKEDLVDSITGVLIREICVEFDQVEKNGQMFTENLRPISSKEFYTKSESSNSRKGIVWLLKLDNPFHVQVSEGTDREEVSDVIVFIKGLGLQYFFELNTDRKNLSSELGLAIAELKTIYQRITVTTENTKSQAGFYSYQLKFKVEPTEIEEIKSFIPELNAALSLPIVNDAPALPSASREVITEADEERLNEVPDLGGDAAEGEVVDDPDRLKVLNDNYKPTRKKVSPSESVDPDDLPF